MVINMTEHHLDINTNIYIYIYTVYAEQMP